MDMEKVAQTIALSHPLSSTHNQSNIMHLSPHFQLVEFIRSSTADVLDIDNTLSPLVDRDLVIISNLARICHTILEPLRTHARCPIIISSGYRSPTLNRAVGGAAHSQHLTGEAVDIRIPSSETGREWFEWMRTHLPFDQLIKERATRSSPTFWIHVSLRASGDQRQQVIDNLVKNKA